MAPRGAVENRPLFARDARGADGLRLALSAGMPRPFRRSLPIAGVAAMLMAGGAGADVAAQAPPPHVRAESPEGRALIAELAERSAIGHALLDALQRADVLVYVRYRVFATSSLEGRIGLVPSGGGRQRVLIVEIACLRGHLEQLVTLAHELCHATEIAADATVVDAGTLSAYYSRIGERTRMADVETFETRTARDTAAAVRRELVTTTMRTLQ